MKINDLLHENADKDKFDEDYNNIKNILKNECSDVIEQFYKHQSEYVILHKSTKSLGFYKMISNISERAPKDTPKLLHDFYNNYFSNKFNIPYRSNALFAYLKESEKLEHFSFRDYLVFPKNGAKILIGKNIRDLTVKINYKIRTIVNEIFDKKLKFIDGKNNIYWRNNGAQLLITALHIFLKNENNIADLDVDTLKNYFLKEIEHNTFLMDTIKKDFNNLNMGVVEYVCNKLVNKFIDFLKNSLDAYEELTHYNNLIEKDINMETDESSEMMIYSDEFLLISSEFFREYAEFTKLPRNDLKTILEHFLKF